MARLGAIAGQHSAGRTITIWVDKDTDYRMLEQSATYFDRARGFSGGRHLVSTDAEDGDVFAEVKIHGH